MENTISWNSCEPLQRKPSAWSQMWVLTEWLLDSSICKIFVAECIYVDACLWTQEFANWWHLTPLHLLPPNCTIATKINEIPTRLLPVHSCQCSHNNTMTRQMFTQQLYNLPCINCTRDIDLNHPHSTITVPNSQQLSSLHSWVEHGHGLFWE